MNSPLIHVHNHPTIEDGNAVTSTGYLPSPSGLASIEPQAGVSYDHRVAFDTLGAQQHSMEMSVSLLDASPSKSGNELPRTRTHFPPQIYALGLLPGIVSNCHVPFTADPHHPATTDFNSCSSFDRNVHLPSGPPGVNHRSNYDFLMGAHSPSPPVAAGSISVLPEQRPTINSTRSAAPPTAWPGISNFRGHPTRSDGASFVSKNSTNHAPSRIEGATPTAHTFTDIYSIASSPGVYSAAQSASSTFPPYPRGRFSTNTPVPQGSVYPTPRRASSTSPISHPVSPPVLPTRRNFLSSAAPSEKPVAHPVPQKECTEQEKAGRTLRSVRTRSEDVFAEYELSADQTAGRWVCQCGSTFVRDSDWERHAMHSLSHSEGGGYDCSICDISFTRSDAMFRHRRKKHGDTMPGGRAEER